MGVGLILDIIVLAILGLSIFLGYKKGLIGVIFSLCAVIIAIILTVILAKPVTDLVINNTQLDDNIKNAIIENGLLEKNEDASEDGSINGYIEKYITNSIKEGVNNTIENNAQAVAEKVVAIIVTIGLFIVLRIALILIKFIAEGIAELPVVKQFNELGGILYGILRGIIVIYVFFAICFFIVSISNSEFITTAINTSLLSKFLYNNNIILSIIF